MKILIAYDGSSCADPALEDLRKAGLPRLAEAAALSASELRIGLFKPQAGDFHVDLFALNSRRNAFYQDARFHRLIRFERHLLFWDYADCPVTHGFSLLIEYYSAHLQFVDGSPCRIPHVGGQFHHYDARRLRCLCRFQPFDVDEPLVLLEARRARAQKFFGRRSLRRDSGSAMLHVEERNQGYQYGAAKQQTCE